MSDGARSRILTLVFTDLVDSLALKLQRGDQRASELIGRHRAHTSELASQATGRIIDWAGDGCFFTFESPSAAVLFALRLQQIHQQEPHLPGVRAGIHLGEVSERPGNVGDAAQVRVEGLAVDLGARICALARAGQVLVSSAVADRARQRLDDTSFNRPVRWHAHGSHRIKDFDGTIGIHEVGVDGQAPFVATALGIMTQGVRNIAQAIAEALPGRRLLIALDNCEHVLDAAAGLRETEATGTSVERPGPHHS